MHISESGLKLIEAFEGFSSVQYNDGTGVMTIGFGTTSADFSPLPTFCTRAQAEGWLRTKLAQKYEPAVNALGVPLNQNQFDALVSLVYNCGPGAMQWQIGRDLRARRYLAAANDFGLYVYAGGRVLQGLVNRRHAEKVLFLTAPAPPPRPPRPPDPFAIFTKGSFDFRINGKKVSLVEHDVVVKADGALKEPVRYRGYLKGTLYPELRELRDRVKSVATASHPAAWADNRHLGQRWQALNHYMKRINSIR